MGKKRRKPRAPQAQATKSPDQEPWWEPLAYQRLDGWQKASILARHLIPLAGLLLLGGSAAQFLLLCVFNIALTVTSIGTVGVSVSMREEMRSLGLANEIGSWGTLLAITLGFSALLTGLFGWVLALAASSLDADGLWTKSLAWSVLAIVLCTGPDLFRQYRQDVAAKLPEEQRKRRDQPIVFMHLFCAGLIFLLSGYAIEAGRIGLTVLAFVVTALFIFRDLRPDLMRQLARPSGR